MSVISEESKTNHLSFEIDPSVEDFLDRDKLGRGMWSILHYLSYYYHSEESLFKRKQYYRTIETFFLAIKNYFCRACVGHMTNYIHKTPISENKGDLISYFNTFHNIVNTRTMEERKNKKDYIHKEQISIKDLLSFFVNKDKNVTLENLTAQQKVLMNMKNYDFCSCGVFYLLHLLSYLIQIEESNVNRYREAFDIILKIAIDDCFGNYKKYVDVFISNNSIPNFMNDNYALFEWTVDFHNHMSNSINKEKQNNQYLYHTYESEDLIDFFNNYDIYAESCEVCNGAQ